MVLLSGGAGARFGAPKHLQEHPEGGSWASFLVDLFVDTLGAGPIRILGEPVPGRPDLCRFDDPREGPAKALSRWAALEQARPDRWWVVACDQVNWNATSLEVWCASAREADPAGAAWVMPEIEGETQPLGGFLGTDLLPAVGRSSERRLLSLARSLPSVILPWTAAPFLDVDDPGAHERWLQERRRT